ncbi:hypothetical protein A2210_00775 [Candidatus Woesebacteria bacterium RIFOXYA1_FULL_40_18]|uniref:Uncharacterized protein n=4 Tax=Candidatus Woeseibacteriota TaxID=1752722 RepID=A0A0G0SD45_9BACT|nr:MAG: hypothetical protein UU03_C0022G0008 [Candidatus Woesebacteria bacterium GW2011_GWA1_40_45]OGM76499.1 MAG: hypothetical protein A2210_00775 [Candidatus Woesebacteria bacterium RIFOXYA1_FULL_40_18]OGM80334.1 MAG: hypothetical protein A2361_02780 [Candidatus Woesebacteria bacterium RIFOXYB1_FULL_40_26]
MKRNKGHARRQAGFSPILIIVMITVVGVIAFFLGKQLSSPKTQTPSASPTPTPEITSTPTSTSIPNPTKPGWKIYKNEQYGFEFSYPASYKVLTDSENLYGWPKAILLLYKGGQSYDMAVEIWNTEAEYKAKYLDTSTFSVFETKDGKFITLLNANKESQVSEIVATFKFAN